MTTHLFIRYYGLNVGTLQIPIYPPPINDETPKMVICDEGSKCHGCIVTFSAKYHVHIIIHDCALHPQVQY